MFEKAQLRAFAQLPSPVLTVYADTNPGRPSNRGPSPEYVTYLNSAGRAIAGKLPPEEQKAFREQLDRIEAFLHDRVSPPRGMLIFAGTDVWMCVPLQVEVKNELHWGKPVLFPLLGLISRHKPYGIAAVDRAGVRFFHYQLGEMSQIEERKLDIDISHWRKKDMGKVAHVGISKSRGTDHDAFEQRMEAQYRRWLSEVADRARELCSERGLAALFLVGSERLVEPIAASLPREIQPRVVMIEEDLGGIVSPVLEERVEPAIAQWERSQESDAVSALLDDAHGATTGIDATLAELQRGGVRILMVAEGVNTTLSQCTRCGWADRSDDSVCSACGSVKQTVDLREALPELAWNHGAEFEIVRGDASTRLIEAGGMGGWLRQPKPAALKRPAARAS